MLSLERLIIQRVMPWMKANLSSIRKGPNGEVTRESFQDLRAGLKQLEAKIATLELELFPYPPGTIPGDVPLPNPSTLPEETQSGAS